jgi:energy-converting hydrogenase Eha subunit C
MEIKVMMNKVDLKAVLVLLVCVLGVIGMVNGNIQNVIKFQDPLNEMLMVVLMSMGALGALMNIRK